MGMIGGELGYQLLRRIAPRHPRQGCLSVHNAASEGTAEAIDGSLIVHFGPEIFERVRGKDVIDFGCGVGIQAIELAKAGAKSVTGVDIREHALSEARTNAIKAGVADRCEFVSRIERSADVILSKDAFEHFPDPEAVLDEMRQRLKPDGKILAAFGPTWYHPYGGHLFSVFPWAHLIFTEASLIRWRSDFKSDGATRFGEVEGGLNQMSIRKFEKIIRNSGFRVKSFETIPIRGISVFRYPVLREFGSSLVRCELVLK
ncbi:hypothetical protein CKO35_16430 [Ectothiorhodospira shaposhnikovii]|uniref:class I SAM-dependent methyltransferase n=1 Tax=Ectothiorhodospira shaposhnikovii TaxID=1054 RepID=UPI0019074E79|nr:class I SAM-dependent methyltransferase [Ectothiorhodospira shaposhnikovii]MBK1674844.1 hypothetical protein [Ectothiorhodospira shaposhnikovii]